MTMAISINTTQLKSDVIAKVSEYQPKILFTIITIVVAFIIIRIIERAVRKLFEKVDMERAVEVFIENTIGFILWIIVGIVILSAWGVDVGAFIAGLGILGFVLGFALKDTLGNLASGIFLLTNRPFRLNDYVDVSGISGTVKNISIAACTLKTPDNKMITLQNTLIWGSPITNYTGYDQRRMDIRVGISYEADINKAIKICQDLIKKEKKFLKDPEPVIGVMELANSSVDLIVRPWVKTSDYWDIFFKTNKKIKESFDKHKIPIPYPQMDIHIKDHKKEK